MQKEISYVFILLLTAYISFSQKTVLHASATGHKQKQFAGIAGGTTRQGKDV